MTGEGLRRLRGFADRAGLEPSFRGALCQVRTITRGPKPAQALREIGRLIEEIAAGRIDALAFTSTPQVGQLFAMARAAKAEPRLRAALEQTRIAAVGPVVAAELERHGLAVAIMPEGSFFMKPFVTAIAAALSG